MACLVLQTQKQIHNRMAEKQIKVLQWSSQSLDCNVTEMLWQNIKRTVHKQMPKSMKWSNLSKKTGWEFLHNNVRDL